MTSLHITDKLAKLPDDTLMLLVSQDQDARKEWMRRRLGQLCARRFLKREQLSGLHKMLPNLLTAEARSKTVTRIMELEQELQ